MKKALLSIVFGIAFISISLAQTFEVRTVESSYGYLEVQFRETSGVGTPTTTTNITDITYQIRWPQSLGDVDVDLLCATNDYHVIDGLGTRESQDTYYYRTYTADPVPFNPPNNWTQDVWETIAIHYTVINSGTASGTFEVAPDGWVAQGLNWGQGGADYTPTVNGSVSNYDVPTTIYNYVWVGGFSQSGLYDGGSWDNPANWASECDEVISAAPGATDNVLIPGGLANYPNNFNLLPSILGASSTINNLRIAANASLTIPTGADPNFGSLEANEIIILDDQVTRAAGTLTINPSGSLTANGSTTFSSAQQIKILADATGIGSFIDNGTINYGLNGTALVETYLLNGGPDHFFHQVTPAVYENGLNPQGVQLQQFNLTIDNTYAYLWNEPTQLWDNIYLNNTVVETGQGMMLTTDDGSQGTYDLEGRIENGNVDVALTLSGDTNIDSYGWNLVGNPYVASLDMDVVWTRYSAGTIISPNIYVLDNGLANYLTYNMTTAGGALDPAIQVGQAVWIQCLVNPGTTIQFQPGDRVHSQAPFLKDMIPNALELFVEGNSSGDYVFVMFREDGSAGYDSHLDAEKWDSPFEWATEAWSMAGDHRLTSNVQPQLGTDLVTVPLSVKVTEVDSYTITASDIESFPQGTEIYLEDLIEGGEWYNLVENPVYEFMADPGQAQERFLLHFFGPTDIDEPFADNTVRIYSYGQDAYILNHGNEILKEYRVVDLMGREIRRGQLENKDLNKVFIEASNAYVVVEVITGEGKTYSEKVFLSK